MKFDLRHVDIRSIMLPAFFQTPHVKEEVVREANVGLRDMERGIVAILDQEISSYAIKLDDVASIIGLSGKEMRSHIKAAQKVAREKYDGTYDPPEMIDIETQLYVITAIVISESGRISEDITSYTVRANMDEIFDLSAIQSAADFACYCYLMEYFEHCLNHGKVPISVYLKDYSNVMVTKHKLTNFIKKNSWYEDREEFCEIFGVYISSPKLPDVANYGFEKFEDLRRQIFERNQKEEESETTTTE